MRILFASSEVFPLIKTGGLADVSGALPAALRDLGVDARVVMPGYPVAMEKAGKTERVAALGDPFGVGADAYLVAAELPGSGVPVWLIDCPSLYARPGGPYQDATGQDHEDNALRFALLSWTAARLCSKDSPIAWRPDILHANDWQSGLAPAYLHAWGETAVSSVFTVHNIAYQGLFPKEVLPDLGLPWELYQIDGLEYYDQISFLKAGLFYSDRITTVSRRYAREIQTPAFGSGMEGLLAHRAADLVGILNGADYGVWDPATDENLFRRYPAGAYAEGKAANKAALQAELGLTPSPDAPLMVIVSRLTDQKGMDLVLSDLPAFLGQGCQLAVLGTGDRLLEEGFRAAAANSPAQVAATIGYSESLAHKLIAGGDMLLMPSRFEPCGLTQLYALRYGTIPIVHATGGLADTVVDATYDGLMTQTATGFVFEHTNPGAFQWCVERAVALFRKKAEWNAVQDACVRQDFSWRRSAVQYVEFYHALVTQGAGAIL